MSQQQPKRQVSFPPNDGRRPSLRQRVADSMPIVRKTIACMRVPKQERDDMAQEAMIRLLKVAHRHDPAKGKWSTFVMVHTRGAVRDFARSKASRLLNQPRADREKSLCDDCAAAAGGMDGESEYHAGTCDGCHRLAMVRTGLRGIFCHSLSAHARDPGQDRQTLADAIPVEDDRFAVVDEADFAEDVLRCVGPRERKIIRLRYGYGLGMKEIGSHLHISESRVSQLLARALDVVRHRAGVC